MGISLIIGKSGSGKTTYCIQKMIQLCGDTHQTRGLLIVPEQLSFQMQKNLIDQSKRHGIMNMEVLSFNRLATRIVEETGRIVQDYLDDTGKNMLIRHLIEQNKFNLPITYHNRNKKGMIEQLTQSITEIFNYQWDSEQLNQLIETPIQGLNAHKMAELVRLYQIYNEKVTQSFITDEKMVELLIQKAHKSRVLASAYIFVDGFVGLTPAQQKIISALSQMAKHVTVTLIGDKQLPVSLDSSDLFYDPLNTGIQLKELIGPNVFIEEVLLNDNYRYARNKMLLYGEAHLFDYGYRKAYQETINDAILIKNHPTLYDECEWISQQIHQLIVDHKTTYRSIAVLVGQLDTYKSLLAQSFETQNIPFFIDENKSLIFNPIGQFVLRSLEVSNKYFGIEALFSFLKSGFVPMSWDELDLLENYGIAYHIAGKQHWISEWHMPYPNSWLFDTQTKSDYISKIETAQINLKKWIEPLKDIAQANVPMNAQEFQTYIYQLLEYYPLQREEEENSQAFDKILEILDKILEILSSERLELVEWTGIFKTAMEQTTIGVVPLIKDCCLIGDFKRSKLIETEYLFVLGAYEGGLDVGQTFGSYISDYERTKLKEHGYVLSRTNREKQFVERINLYHGLFKPSKQLIITYPSRDITGNSCEPAFVYKRLQELFQLDETVHQAHAFIDTSYKKATFIRIVREGLMTDGINHYFAQFPHYQALLNRLAKMSQYHQRKICLSEQALSKIYSEVFTQSISKLESYSKCPFMYHAMYNLQLKNRYESELTYPDMGTIYHHCLEQVTSSALKQNIDLSKIEDKKLDQLIHQSVDELMSDPYYQYIFSTERNQFFLNRMMRILKRTFWALGQQIESGVFKIASLEHAFTDKDHLKTLKMDLRDKKTMKLIGKIDRMDQYEDQNEVLLKIMDYKSGKESFSYAAVYYGLKLQLLVYTQAMAETIAIEKDSIKTIQPIGLFYYQLKDPMIEIDHIEGIAKIEDEMFSALKMQGVVVNEPQYIQKLDRNWQENQSNIFQVKTSRSSESNMLSREEMDQLLAFGLSKAKQIGNEMLSGKIYPEPIIQENHEVCEYCQYISVCKTTSKDENRQVKNIGKMDKDTFFEMIQAQKESSKE